MVTYKAKLETDLRSTIYRSNILFKSWFLNYKVNNYSEKRCHANDKPLFEVTRGMSNGI